MKTEFFEVIIESVAPPSIKTSVYLQNRHTPILDSCTNQTCSLTVESSSAVIAVNCDCDYILFSLADDNYADAELTSLGDNMAQITAFGRVLVEVLVVNTYGLFTLGLANLKFQDQQLTTSTQDFEIVYSTKLTIGQLDASEKN